MDASATGVNGRLEWCTAVCSLVLIAISLFLFIIFVNVVLGHCPPVGPISGRSFARKKGKQCLECSVLSTET